ncbi:MAG: MBL fold metallo-hydrolase [Acidimicrobiales bacterium]
MSEILTIETPGLGDRSYVVHDGEVAVVVDPQRDTDRIESLVERLGLRIALVVETHLHNDYVTGGYALAQSSGAAYVVAADDEVEFERVGAHDGDRFDAGRLSLTVVHTPGHTPNHLSYVLREDGGEPLAVFTGGSMLFGAVGRTDLIAAERTDELSRAQYKSVRRLAGELPDGVAVHPTHGFGSFCSATQTTGDSSTIGNERKQNVALTTEDEDAFVKGLIEGLSAYPSYYAHMTPANAAGPAAPDLSPPSEVDVTELRRRIDAGEWVVDLRNRVAFARKHVDGTISIELGDPFATYLGWTMPWGSPLTLVGESVEQLAEAKRQLVRIGIDHIGGGATGETDALSLGKSGSYAVADFKDLASARSRDDVVVLDVRRPDEWNAGHLRDATHIPFWELEERVGEVPEGEVWVHCASGFRASIAASLLARAGRKAVLIDEDWDAAGEAGLPVTS